MFTVSITVVMIYDEQLNNQPDLLKHLLQDKHWN